MKKQFHSFAFCLFTFYFRIFIAGRPPLFIEKFFSNNYTGKRFDGADKNFDGSNK